MTIGDRIRTLREERGMSQLDLAKKMGFKTKGAISHIENAGNDVTLKNIRKAADALGVDPNVIMKWDEEPPADGFYINQKTAQIAEKIYQDKYMGMVFDTLKDSSPEQIINFYDMLQLMKRAENHEG